MHCFAHLLAEKPFSTRCWQTQSLKVPLFEIASFVGGLIYVSKCVISINHLKLANITNIIFDWGSTTAYDHRSTRSVGSHDHLADRRSLTLGLLLFLSWVPIYLFYTTSTDLLDDISRRETKYALDEHILFYEAFDSLTPMVARAEIILNWFVLIKFTLIIIAVKGTIEPPVTLEG